MPFYRGYYLNITDFDVTSVSAKKVKSNDGREVLVAKTALTSKSVVCHIANPLLVALDSVELKKRCYTCYHPRNELLALQLSRADDGRYDDLVLCEGCEVVSFCSSVSPFNIP